MFSRITIILKRLCLEQLAHPHVVSEYCDLRITEGFSLIPRQHRSTKLGDITHSQLTGVMSLEILVSWGQSLAAYCRFQLRWIQTNWWVRAQTLSVVLHELQDDENIEALRILRGERKSRTRERKGRERKKRKTSRAFLCSFLKTFFFLIFCEDLTVHCRILSWPEHSLTSVLLFTT